MAKQVTIKVYKPTGEYITTWKTAKFSGFTKRLNGGLGDCLIELGEVVTYSGVDLDLNNEVRIIITDTDTIGTSDGEKLIYSGYISNYVPWINSSGEGINVFLLGYYTKLAQDVLKNGDITTFYSDTTTGIGTPKTGTLADIGLMMRATINRYIAETTNPKLNYTAGTLQLTNTTAKYKFESMTYREVIEIILSMSPNGWFWYVDELGLVHFRAKPTTPTHKFVYGKDFSAVRIERSMEKLKNALIFWNGKLGDDQVYKLYSDLVSVAKYGRRLIRRTDERILDVGGASDTADKIGNKFVDEHKDPDIKVVVDIIDNNENGTPIGYDIESINPGDTCTFYGFDESLADLFKYNMLITKVDYELNKATITVEPLDTSIISRQEQIGTEVKEISEFDSPLSLSEITEGISRARAYNNAGQTISNSSWTKLVLDTEEFDGLDEFDPVTLYRFTAKVAGYYIVSGAVTWDSTVADKTYKAAIAKNGSSVALSILQASIIGILSNFMSTVVYLDVGDYLEINVFQDSGGNEGITNSKSGTFLSVHRLS